MFILSQALAANETSLYFQPETIQLAPGQMGNIVLYVDSTENIQGADIFFQFNPAVVRIVDAYPTIAGQQVLAGTCPQPGISLVNTTTNATGFGEYAAIELATNCTTGIVFTVTVFCRQRGSTIFQIDDARISDPAGNLLAPGIVNATVVCNSATPTAMATATVTSPPQATATTRPGTALPTSTPRFATPTQSPTATPTPTSTPRLATPTSSPTATPAPPTATGTPTPTFTPTSPSATETSPATRTPRPAMPTTPEDGSNAPNAAAKTAPWFRSR